MIDVWPIIGVDESGKGDFFGPLVIASFLSDESDNGCLAELGVRDGKLIAEGRILQIDEELRRTYAHSVVVIGPEKYNALYERIRNLNKLLAWGHAQAIENLATGHEVDLAISDKFGKTELIEESLAVRKLSIRLEQIVRGEAVPQVAAASIIARATFIRFMKKLSAQCGVVLPKGASAAVDEAARSLVRRHGVDILAKVAKLHFKNYQRVVTPGLFSR